MSIEVLLDASAILAWLHNEDGADVVDPFLMSGSGITSVNLGEVLYKVATAGDDPGALYDDLVELGIEIVPFDAGAARRFPDLKELDRTVNSTRKKGRPKQQLSLADLCCLATALELNAKVITGDRYWTELPLALDIVDYNALNR